MITLNVYFNAIKENNYGTAVLLENLITGDAQLEIDTSVHMNEINYFIDKAVSLLQLRYEKIEVKVHWDSAVKEEK